MAAPSPTGYASNSQTSGTSMNIAVGAGTDALIIVHLASRSTSESFTTPTLTGVTFALVSNPTAGRTQHEDAVYAAYGTWGAGNVVCGFSQSTLHAGQAFIYNSDQCDPTTPYTFVKYRNTNGDSGAGSGGTDNTAPTIVFSNTDVEQDMLVLASTRNRPLNSNPGDADYSRIGAVASGTGGSDQSLTAEHRTLSPFGSDTWLAATGIAVDWITWAILVNPKASATVVTGVSGLATWTSPVVVLSEVLAGITGEVAWTSPAVVTGAETIAELLVATVAWTSPEVSLSQIVESISGEVAYTMPTPVGMLSIDWAAGVVTWDSVTHEFEAVPLSSVAEWITYYWRRRRRLEL